MDVRAARRNGEVDDKSTIADGKGLRRTGDSPEGDGIVATTSRRSRSRRGEGDKLRDEILDVTERLLVELGDEAAVSIRAVADAVGRTAPAIYLHFSDKDELIQAVCNRRFEEFHSALETAGAQSDDPLESLRLRGEAYIRFGLDHPQHYKVLMMTARPQPVDVTVEAPGMAAFRHLVAAVQRCIDDRVFPGDHDAVKVALTLWSAVHGITALLITLPKFESIAGGPDGVEAVIQTLLDVQMEGLLAV